MDLLPLHFRAIPDADDVELFLEPLGHAAHGIRDETPRQPVKLPELVVLTLQPRHERAVFRREHDTGRQRLPQLPLGALDLDGVWSDLDGHPSRNRDRLLTNSRHCNQSREDRVVSANPVRCAIR